MDDEPQTRNEKAHGENDPLPVREWSFKDVVVGTQANSVQPAPIRPLGGEAPNTNSAEKIEPDPKPLLVNIVGGDELSAFERRTVFYGALGIFLGFFSLIAAVIAAFFVFHQFKEMEYANTLSDIAARRARHDSAETSLASEKQLATLQGQLTQQRTSMEVDQRAWMDITIQTPQYFQADKPFGTLAELKNLGKTPAKDVKFAFRFEATEPSLKPIFDDKSLEFVNIGPLPPQGPAPFPVEIDPKHPDLVIGVERLAAIRDGKVVVFFWGVINYKDTFDIRHWLKFAYIFNVPHRRFDLVSSHNDIDADNR